MYKCIKSAKELSRGVFWDIDGTLLAFPFIQNNDSIGVAKSGTTYNHKKLCPDIKPHKCNEPYNYYPRGRVEINSKGKAIIYMNPNVSDSLLSEIRQEFGMITEPRIIYDGSEHYKCYLDEGWEPGSNNK